MRWVSEADITRVPRNSRICSFERLIMPWRLRVWPCLILPLAVNRKRFFAPDFVFSLGILRLLKAARGRNRVREPPRHALFAGRFRSKEAALYARPSNLQARAQ